MNVVLDTNALMMPVECNVRLFDEVERLVGKPTYLVPEAVVAELEKLADGSGTEATAASVGLDLLARCEQRETEHTYADDAVIELTYTVDAEYVVTNDRPLKERLHAEGVSVISLRGGTKLGINN